MPGDQSLNSCYSLIIIIYITDLFAIKSQGFTKYLDIYIHFPQYEGVVLYFMFIKKSEKREFKKHETFSTMLKSKLTNQAPE